jgi:long-chain acyl-CoA synthetase
VPTLREAVELVVRDDPAFQLETIDIRGVPCRVYKNAPPSLRSVFEASADFGSRDYLVYQDERWTFDEHRTVVAGLASLWANEGVGKGDRVAIAMRNYPEWVMTFWAAATLGAIVVPLNAWWTADELTYGLRDSEPTLLVADEERISALAPVLADLPMQRVIAVRSGTLPTRVVSWEDELARIDHQASLPDVEVLPDDDATILYTSGTTGSPKGAIGTHRNHVTNIRNSELQRAAGLVAAGISPPADPPQASVLQTFPLFHIAGLTGLHMGTVNGSKLSLMYKWDTEEAVAVIRREQVNVAGMVPTLLRRLLDHAESEGIHLPSLRTVGGGGAPTPPDLVRRITGVLGDRVSPGTAYGLTETTSSVSTIGGEEYRRHPGSVGRLVPGTDIRVVDPETGEEQAVGAIGEFWFRGPNVVRGYWNKPAETAAAFSGGWFGSGDLGYVDEDGLLFVVDRLKDVIIRGGENIYCAEVEAVLFEHPAVADVGLVGVPHESWGEAATAVVQTRPGSSIDESTLQDHVAERLAAFKIPERIVFVDEPLPRTATGKLLKRELREDVINSAPGANAITS